MPKNIDNFKKDLEGFLRINGANRIMIRDLGNENERFEFNFKKGSNDYGPATIMISDRDLIIFFNQNLTKDSEVSAYWTDFLQKLKDWSLRNGNVGFKIDNLDRLNSELKKREIFNDNEQISEGYYGTRNTSYSDSTPKNIKMIIKHNKSLDENDRRYQHIDRIFLETELGERLLLNTKKPSIGRVYARHLAEGGEYNDEKWKHISELASDISKLSGFVRAAKSNQFNESVNTIIEEVTSHYAKLKETIKRLQGQRGYHNYFENWKPTIIEQESTIEDLSSLFKTQRIDPRIEAALPVLNKLNIKHNEIIEANEFEDWANSIIENITPIQANKIDKLVKIITDKDEISVGADAINIKGQLEDIIDDDKHRENLFKELDISANVDPNNDAKPIIISWLQKHRNEKFYGDVIDEYEKSNASTSKEEPKKSAFKAPASDKEKAPQPTPKQPQPTQQPAMSPQDQKAMQSLMPEPLKEDIDLVLIKKLSGIKL